MKVEFTMSLRDAVLLEIALKDGVCACDDSIVNFVKMMVGQAIATAEKAADAAAMAPTEAEAAMFRRGERIEAIQALRARVGCGLKEAKDAIDRAVATPSFAATH
jgi:ribosomal protein L7/L12